MAEAFCYLTTVGRRTGRPHTIEIWFAGTGDTLYLMAGGRERADWVRNLRHDPHVSVRIGAQTRAAVARIVDPASEEDALARRLMLEKYQQGDELEPWGLSALPVALDLG